MIRFFKAPGLFFFFLEPFEIEKVYNAPYGTFLNEGKYLGFLLKFFCWFWPTIKVFNKISMSPWETRQSNFFCKDVRFERSFK